MPDKLDLVRGEKPGRWTTVPRRATRAWMGMNRVLEAAARTPESHTMPGHPREDKRSLASHRMITDLVIAGGRDACDNRVRSFDTAERSVKEPAIG